MIFLSQLSFSPADELVSGRSRICWINQFGDLASDYILKILVKHKSSMMDYLPEDRYSNLSAEFQPAAFGNSESNQSKESERTIEFTAVCWSLKEKTVFEWIIFYGNNGSQMNYN